jgi:hypothetical protein
MPAPNERTLQRLPETQDLELLTQQALEASQAGDWDRVATCYACRGINLQTAVSDRALAQRLMAIDAQVRAAALVAQAAISSLLADNAQVKHQLRRLRESTGSLSATECAIHREA